MNKNKEKLIHEIKDICRGYDDITKNDIHDNTLFNKILLKCLYNHTSLKNLSYLRKLAETIYREEAREELLRRISKK